MRLGKINLIVTEKEELLSAENRALTLELFTLEFFDRMED